MGNIDQDMVKTLLTETMALTSRRMDAVNGPRTLVKRTWKSARVMKGKGE